MFKLGRQRLLAARCLVAAAVVAAMLGVMLAPAPAAVAATGACGDGVVVLGARGSGQERSSYDGLGPEVSAGYQSVRDTLRTNKWPDSRIRFQVVEYPAEAVGTLFSNADKGPQIFFNSIKIGVDNAITQLLQIQNGLRAGGSACDGGRIVLMGYSQGAMVMHQVLEQLSPGGADANPELLGRIGGAILIADGYKTSGSAVNGYTPSGRYPTGAVGVGQQGWAQNSGAPKVRAIPSQLRNKVYNVCLGGDLVCDSSRKLADEGKRYLDGAGDVHGSVYKTDEAFSTGQFGAAPALGRLLNVNLPTPFIDSGTPGNGPKPQGDCNGETVGKSYIAACLIVRRGVVVQPDYANVTVLGMIDPNDSPNYTGGNVTPTGRRQLNRIGLDYRVFDSCPGGQQFCDSFTGTPNAKAGVYPFGYFLTRKDGSKQTVKAFVQIVP